MSIPTEAIDAAARAMRTAAINGGLTVFPVSFYERNAELTLNSAAPAIQAAAVAEALEKLAVKFEATASCASYVGTEDIMETWLNAAQRARKAIEAAK